MLDPTLSDAEQFVLFWRGLDDTSTRQPPELNILANAVDCLHDGRIQQFSVCGRVEARGHLIKSAILALADGLASRFGDVPNVNYRRP